MVCTVMALQPLCACASSRGHSHSTETTEWVQATNRMDLVKAAVEADPSLGLQPTRLQHLAQLLGIDADSKVGQIRPHQLSQPDLNPASSRSQCVWEACPLLEDSQDSKLACVVGPPDAQASDRSRADATPLDRR